MEEASLSARAAHGKHMLPGEKEPEQHKGSKSSQSTISNSQSTISNSQSAISNPQSADSSLQSTDSSLQLSGVRESVSVSADPDAETGASGPPSLPQVKKYVLEEGLRFLPEDFVDYYSARGWIVGGQPVRDWKALARRWGRKEKQNGISAQDGSYSGAYC